MDLYGNSQILALSTKFKVLIHFTKVSTDPNKLKCNSAYCLVRGKCFMCWQWIIVRNLVIFDFKFIFHI